MLKKRGLHLERTDSVARTLDNVIVSADEPEIAVFVAVCLIAGVIEPVHEGFAVCLLIVEIFDNETDRSGIERDGNPALLIVFHGFSFIVVKLDIPAGRGFTHGTGLVFDAGEGRNRTAGLGLTVSFMDGKPRSLLPDSDDLGV